MIDETHDKKAVIAVVVPSYKVKRHILEVLAAIGPEIARIYQSPDAAETRALLEGYRIDYVYLGPLERAKYRPSEAALAKLDGLLTRAFENEAVVIYARQR
ncbi:MAG TPA: hypothetical protein PLJ34_09210 [Hyphomicrobiales bacterium]|nr:hypothetical protein [Hyphomicrobiales bacterium]